MHHNLVDHKVHLLQVPGAEILSLGFVLEKDWREEERKREEVKVLQASQRKGTVGSTEKETDTRTYAPSRH